MLHFKNIALTIFVLLFFGCASLNKSNIYSDISVSTESKLNAEVKVDLSKKLTGSSTAKYLFGVIRVGGDGKYADGYGGMGAAGKTKSSAAYNALDGSGVDILVSPQYMLEVDNQIWMKTVTATVSGYGGKFTSIKNKQ